MNQPFSDCVPYEVHQDSLHSITEAVPASGPKLLSWYEQPCGPQKTNARVQQGSH
jgi:hypothetical protein